MRRTNLSVFTHLRDGARLEDAAEKDNDLLIEEGHEAGDWKQLTHREAYDHAISAMRTVPAANDQ